MSIIMFSFKNILINIQSVQVIVPGNLCQAQVMFPRLNRLFFPEVRVLHDAKATRRAVAAEFAAELARVREISCD